MKKLKAVLIFVIIFCLAIFGIYMHFQKELNKQQTKYEKLFEDLTTSESEETDKSIMEEKKDFSCEVIKEKLEDIGYLCTEEYQFTEIAHFDSSKRTLFNIKVPLTSSSFTCCYDGVITAGIDFSQIKIELDDAKKTIKVTLPEATINSTEIDEDSFEIYDEKESIFNKTTVKDSNEVLKTVKKKALKKAEDRGLLEKAQTNAKTIISNFIYGFVDSDEYELDFK